MEIDRNRIWDVIKEIQSDAARDPQLADRIRRDPREVLLERGLTLPEINADPGDGECESFGTTISGSVPPRSAD